MIPGYSPVLQAFLGTLFTWGLTAAGAALVICIRGSQRKLLDASLGFAAGVMTAASYWSLLSPAIEQAEQSKIYGQEGQYAFVPVAIGFLLGALFVFGADWVISKLGLHSSTIMIAMHGSVKKLEQAVPSAGINRIVSTTDTTTIEGFSHGPRKRGAIRRNVRDYEDETEASSVDDASGGGLLQDQAQWKRIMLLVIAITVHNIPEGLAVGVGFGAIGSSASATFESASYLQGRAVVFWRLEQAYLQGAFIQVDAGDFK